MLLVCLFIYWLLYTSCTPEWLEALSRHYYLAGSHLGSIPSAQDLAATQVGQFAADQPHLSRKPTTLLSTSQQPTTLKNAAHQPTQVPQLVPAQLENLEHNPQAVIEAWYQQHVYNPAVVIGGTLPSLPKKLIDKIHTGQYVNFTEFPPAKGRVRTPLYDGQLLLVQMEDVASSKKLIPDFSLLGLSVSLSLWQFL